VILFVVRMTFLVESRRSVCNAPGVETGTADARPAPRGHVVDQPGSPTPTSVVQPGAAALVLRIRAGDPAAEEELVRRYERGVRVVVTRASRDRSAVDDICQDVLRLTIEKVRAGAVRDPDRLSGFIAGLARTRVIEHFRRQDARHSLESREPVAAPIAPASQLDRLIERERARIARAVLSHLESDRDREILGRYYIAGDDKGRICADLGLTSLHFNRVLFRARQRYRELFRRLMIEHGLGEMKR
jgi:RNA polymerase sigma-70 factor (ECF subfamily)